MSLFDLIRRTLRGKSSRAATEDHALSSKVCANPIPKPAALAPLGTLSILPRELRDHIYNYVCKQKYRCRFVNKSRYGLRERWTQCGHPMVRVCKAVRDEYHGFLFSRKFFELEHSLFSFWTQDRQIRYQRSDIPFLDDISMVRLVLDLYYMSDDFKLHLQEQGFSSEEQVFMATIRAEPVSFFNGASILRKVCIIELYDCRPTSLLPLLSSPLMHAMRQLTGFTTVQLVFSTHPNHWLEDKTPEHIRQMFYCLETCPGFDAMVVRIISALEPSLGSFARSGLDKTRPWNQQVFSHLQDHSTTKEFKELGVESSTKMVEEKLGFIRNWTIHYHR